MVKKFKKLTLQHAFLVLEKEEIEEICDEADKKMRAYLKAHSDEFKEMLDLPPPKPSSQEATHELDDEDHNEDEEDEEDEETNTPPKNKDLKKLYRKIASKIHPDKENGNGPLFQEAVQAYREDNLARLLEIAGNENIEITELSQESLVLLEKNIETISEEILTLRQTAGWRWHHAKTDEERNAIMSLVLSTRGEI